MTKPVCVKGLVIGEGMPKICVPIMGEDLDSLCSEAEEAKRARADLVEWRADFYREITNKEALKTALLRVSGILGEIPLLFTFRSKEEGGNLEISIEDYISLLLEVAETQKASLIDVEVFRNMEDLTLLIRRLQERQMIVMASSHDFEKTDSKDILKKRFLDMDASGANILKMAVMPKEFEDVAAIMQVTKKVASTCTEKPLVSMAMGGTGSISRIAGENFGSCITFACLKKNSAPGQIQIEALREMMEALHRKNQE